MLLEERQRMTDKLIEDELSTIEELEALNNEELTYFYNRSYQNEAQEEVDQKDEVLELIIKVQEKLTDFFNTDLPAWITNIPDEEIKELAIEKYKVTPEQLFEIVEELKQAYEQD